jgi:FAD:protein FMN transferase
MKQTRIIMGMPVTLKIIDESASEAAFDEVFAYFETVDAKFSTYKDESEISRLNRGEMTLAQSSDDMREIFALAEQTRIETDGYFDIRQGDRYDPSGIVKGWAIRQAAETLRQMGFKNYYVDAGGDIQAIGKNDEGRAWRVGIRNPFDPDEIVKVLAVSNCGVATSGTYIRGQHIYNPRNNSAPDGEILSLTVIGQDIFDADRFATAAFAMGYNAMIFIAALRGFEGYMIDCDGRATFTDGFERYVSHD